ncbi:MAG: hypothetical protein GXO23_00830 [Crenarchaeota archaeon]|nr:hypothetical protein [Thermoproteota archaeon]
MKFRCSICGRDIEFAEVAYLKGDTIICVKCLPKYYVRHICTIVNRRLRGEDHPSCRYCRFIDECNRYIEELRKSLEEKT